MNSSVVSEYDNVDTLDSLSKSYIYRKINDLLYVNTEIEARIFCPLCTSSFSLKFSLFEHLKTFHESFLKQLQVSNENLKFKECPFCRAKFYGKHLAAKHALHHHPKAIKELFVNNNKFKCFFCNIKLHKLELNSVISHIEELHFLDFEEKIFSCETTQEVSVSEFINSTMQDKDLQADDWKDVFMTFKKPSLIDSNVKDFDDSSKINCFDFTELKEQLENLKEKKGAFTSGLNSSKSILKDVKNFNSPKRSARRVLRFDVSYNNEEDKKHSILENKICSIKQFCLNEHNSSSEKKDLLYKPNNTFNESPQHSSTPNFKLNKILKEGCKSNICHKSTFKSYINERKMVDFEFQCGKCRLLFKENLELVSHVKTHHKFSLKGFQPYYNCAICNARFFKNRYLKKHHNLHNPY